MMMMMMMMMTMMMLEGDRIFIYLNNLSQRR